MKVKCLPLTWHINLNIGNWHQYPQFLNFMRVRYSHITLSKVIDMKLFDIKTSYNKHTDFT